MRIRVIGYLESATLPFASWEDLNSKTGLSDEGLAELTADLQLLDMSFELLDNRCSFCGKTFSNSQLVHCVTFMACGRCAKERQSESGKNFFEWALDER